MKKLLFLLFLTLGWSQIINDPTGGYGNISNLTKGLVGQWDLTTASLKGTALGDKTPYENDGTATGATTGANSTSFDGSGNKVQITTASELEVGVEDFSISLWLNLTSNPAATNVIIAKGHFSENDNNVWSINVESDGDMFIDIQGDVGEDRFFTYSGFSTAFLGTWAHVVLATDISGYSYLYVNNVERASSNTSLTTDLGTTDPRPLTIGNNVAGNRGVECEISNIKYYKRLLSTGEVETLYKQGRISSTIANTTKGLVGSWDLKSKRENLGSELVTNGTMEADANWADYNGVATNEQSNEQAHNGTYSRKIIADGASQGIQSNGDPYTTVTGQTYRVELWVYPSTSTHSRLVIRKGDNSTWVYDNEVTNLTQNAWNLRTVDYTETAGGAGAYILHHSGSEGAGTWYIDDVKVRPIQTADTTPYSNHGEVYGATVGSTETTFLQDKYISVADFVTDFASLSVGAVTGWIYSTDLTGTNSALFVMTDMSEGSDYVKCMITQAGTPQMELRIREGGTDAVQLQGNTTITEDTWHHIVFQQTGSGYEFYLNGAVENYSVVSGSGSGTDWFDYLIGADGATIGTWWKTGTITDPMIGDITGVKIYNRSLSATEVETLYKMGR